MLLQTGFSHVFRPYQRLGQTLRNKLLTREELIRIHLVCASIVPSASRNNLTELSYPRTEMLDTQSDSSDKVSIQPARIVMCKRVTKLIKTNPIEEGLSPSDLS